MKIPCQNCEDRHRNCWSECDRYKAYKDEHEEVKKFLYKSDEAGQFLAAQAAKTKKRLKMK